MQTHRFSSLDGLRGMSIILVIGHHLTEILIEIPVLAELLSIFPILIDGQVGVNIFFIVSGFLITNLILQEINKTGKLDYKRFFIRRSLRIFPAYYFLLLFYFILDLFNLLQISRPSWFTSALYLKYFNWHLDWYTAHAWSLSIEEHFYLFWPFLLLFNPNNSRVILFAILVICAGFRYWSHYHEIPWRGAITIFQRLDSIAIGCLIAVYQTRILEFLTKRKEVILLAVLWLLAFPFVVKYAFSLIENTHIIAFFYTFTSSIGTLTTLALGVLVFFSIFISSGRWFKFLNSKRLVQVGLMSYSLYLWQQLFTSDLPVGNSFFPLNLILLFMTGYLSFRFIEKPFLALKERFFSLKAPPSNSTP